MKFRFPLATPTAANRALLPAASAGVLAVLAVFQFASTRDIALPRPGGAGGGVRGVLPEIASMSAPTLLSERSIFSPLRTFSPNRPGTSATAGIAVAGVVTVAGRSFAIIQAPDGRVIRLPVGGRIAGMQLIALTPEGARFIAQGKRVSIAYGATAAPPVPQDTAPEEEQE